MVSQSKPNTRSIALIEAALVTTIWGSSFILVKLALPSLGPLTIAAFRYFLAFLLLLPFAYRRNRTVDRIISKRLWIRLGLIGFSAYAIGNGALFLGLEHLPATTVSFLMSISPIFILFAGVFWLKEIPTRFQMVGVVVVLLGSFLFFLPGLSPGEPLGIAIVLFGMIGFTVFGILGREVARDRQIDTLTLTTYPLGFGGGVLVIAALLIEGIPEFTIFSLTIVLILAVVNTAAGYLLYNHSLQTLTALEMNIILNLAPLVTLFLAYYILGETIESIQFIGMLLMIIGVAFVQQTRKKTQQNTN